MDPHPIYERPEEDQGRKERTDDWNVSEITSFLFEQYDNPLDEFDVDNRKELETKVEEQGLTYDKDSDWRYNQVPELGEKNYDWGITCGLARSEDVEERSTKPDDYVPWEVRLKDENGEVQVEYDNR